MAAAAPLLHFPSRQHHTRASPLIHGSSCMGWAVARCMDSPKARQPAGRRARCPPASQPACPPGRLPASAVMRHCRDFVAGAPPPCAPFSLGELCKSHCPPALGTQRSLAAPRPRGWRCDWAGAHLQCTPFAPAVHSFCTRCATCRLLRALGTPAALACRWALPPPGRQLWSERRMRGNDSLRPRRCGRPWARRCGGIHAAEALPRLAACRRARRRPRAAAWPSWMT